MSSPDPDRLGSDEQELADHLAEQRPNVSPALRRRVRHRIGVAFHRRALRRRTVALAGSGVALLALAAVLASSVPS